MHVIILKIKIRIIFLIFYKINDKKKIHQIKLKNINLYIIIYKLFENLF